MSCDVTQGYHIAKPMPAAEILDWLEGKAAKINEGMRLQRVG